MFKIGDRVWIKESKAFGRIDKVFADDEYYVWADGKTRNAVCRAQDLITEELRNSPLWDALEENDEEEI